MNQTERTEHQFELGLVAELDSQLRNFRKATCDPVCAFYSLFASCYLHDSTDAFHDDLPRGYEDDFFVLRHVSNRIGLSLCHAGKKQSRQHSDRRLLSGGDLRGKTSVRSEHGLGENRDYMLEWLDRLIVPTSPENLNCHLKRFEGLAKGVLTRYLTKVLPGGETQLFVHHPSVAQTEAPLLGLFGRTSCGKTTLVRRLIQELSPAFAWVADLLEVTVEAHTTKIPFIIDFLEKGTASWCYEGLEGRLEGDLSRNENSHLGDICRTANSRSGFWFLIRLPAELSLRVFDLPGLFGFESGPWAERASAVASRLDAVVMPMDRRQVRAEEKATLVETIQHYPHTRCALSLWEVPDESELASRKLFLEEKIYPWLPLHGQVPNIELNRLIRNRIQRMSIFNISKHYSGKDDMKRLIGWLAGIRPWRERTAVACYDDLLELARNASPRRATIAGRSLVLIGILRALNTARIIGYANGSEKGKNG